MEFGILGPLQLTRDDMPVAVPGRVLPRLLAVLLLEAGHVVPRDRLIDAVWEDEPPATAVRQIFNTVSTARGLLLDSDTAEIEKIGEGYRLTSRLEQLDALRFQSLVRLAREQVAASEPQAALASLRDALGLWRGPALAGMTGVIIEAGARRLNEEQAAAHEERAEIVLALGSDEPITADLQRILDAHPYRQHAAELLMTALHRADRTVEALEVYESVRTGLADDLGIDPGQRLRDLHTAILRDDPSLDPPKPLPPPPRPPADSLPPPPQPPDESVHFTGRDDRWRDYWEPDTTGATFVGRDVELRRLSASLSTVDESAQIQVVTGFGALGKTALAVAFVKRHRSRFDGCVFYDFHSYGPNRPETASDALLKILPVVSGLPVAQVARMPPEQRVAAWRAATGGRRLLSVWDNVKDPTQIQSLILRSRGCVTLVTSRDQLDMETTDAPLGLAALGSTEAIAMFSRIAGEDHPASLVGELVRRDLFVPVLVHSHARKVAYGTPLQDIVDDLPETPAKSTVASYEDLFDRLAGSYRHLTPGQRRAFRAFGAHPGATATLGSLAAILAQPISDVRALIAGVVRAGLAERTQIPGPSAGAELRTYAAHDLIRAFGTHLAKAEQIHDTGSEYQAFRETLVQYYQARLQAYTPEAYEWFQSEASSIIGAAVGDSSLQHARLALAIGDIARRHNHYDIAEAALEHANRTFQLLGDEAASARAMLGLGKVDRLRGEYPQATEHYRIARERFESTGESRGAADARWGLGQISWLRGEFEMAESNFSAALQRYTSLDDKWGIAEAHRGLGQVATSLGDLAAAETQLQSALERYTVIGDQAGVGETLRTLGIVAHQRNDRRQARERIQQSLLTYQEINNRGGIADAQLELGQVALDEGELDEAEHHLTAALETFIAIDERHEAAKTRLTLSEVTAQRGDRAAASVQLQTAQEGLLLLGLTDHSA